MAEYRTDDVDTFPAGEAPTLRIFQGGNGDWYVVIAPEGHKMAPAGNVVRVTTSGVRVPGLAPAIAAAARALKGGGPVAFRILELWKGFDVVRTIEGAMNLVEREAGKLEASAAADGFPKSKRVRQKKAAAAELRDLRRDLDALAAPFRAEKQGSRADT